MRRIKIVLLGSLVILIIYAVGPILHSPALTIDFPVVPENVDDFVSHLEAGERVKPENEAKILWANDSSHISTEYVLLYLHGFSASRREGAPVNVDFPKRYGCNAYLARLASHGLETDSPLIDMTPFRLYESAKLALAIAGRLGKKVIVMGTSTGGTLALKLAADFPEKVYGLILYSPNIRIKNSASFLLSKPWGLQIARINFGGNTRVSDDDPAGEICKYWYCRYRAEGAVYLQQLIDRTMNDDVFKSVQCPLFLGYYYKDEQNQDQTVDVKWELKMFSSISTPAANKRSIAFPEAGAHVIACDLMSKSVNEVTQKTNQFAEEILKMTPL